MALKRSAGIGAFTLCAALAGGAEAAATGHDAQLGPGIVGAGTIPSVAVDRQQTDRAEVTLVARRGFGATGRKTAPSGGE